MSGGNELQKIDGKWGIFLACFLGLILFIFTQLIQL